MKKFTILFMILSFAIPALSQDEVHFLNNDSTLTFRKIRLGKGMIKCFPIEKGKPAVIYSNSKIEYLFWKGRHWGPSNMEFYKIEYDLFQNDVARRGALDACRYYVKYKGAATGTFCTTFFAGALLGLIPAISTSATTPKTENLSMPDSKYKEDQSYLTSYKTQAKGIKTKHVWSNYVLGIECAILVGVAVDLVAMMAVSK